MRKLALALAASCLAAVAAPIAAGASAGNVSFSGYDYTQAMVIPCDPVNKPYCDRIPFVSATSHFNTSMIGAAKLYHYPVSDQTCGCGQRASIGPAAGQAVGVLCYRGIWDKIDVTLTVPAISVESGTHRWIGYVPDSLVNLSYSDRVTYTPAC